MSYNDFDDLMKAHNRQMKRVKIEKDIYKNLFEAMVMINEIKTTMYKMVLTGIGLYAGLFFGLKMIMLPHS
jgi:hypothetical protein